MTLPSTTDLRSYSGAAAFDGPPAFETAASAWHGRLTVRHIAGLKGGASRWPFMVTATWTGPRMAGYAAGAPDGDSSDMVMVETLELARAVALRAADEISALRVPNLREILRGLRARAT